VRRIVTFLVLLLCAVVPAFAQDTAPVPVVGVRRIDTTANLAPFARMLRDAFAALGYVDGKNLRLDFRLTEGDTKRLPELAEALVREKVSVIYAAGPAAARAAQGATRTIPIVATGSDLVALGLITSLAKPGGNITGVSLLIPELDAKRLEVLKEIVPSGQRFGLISDPATNGSTGLQAIADAAVALGVEVQTAEVRGLTELPTAFTSLHAWGAEGVNILSSPLLFSLHQKLGELLLADKLPGICEWREMAASGCLASYGTTLRELVAIVAALTDKILKGAHPGDMPAQQPTKFEFIVNMGVARAIGLTIPPTILARVDEVIE
jgi:putative tryptophan/tyrosine transport system substrate-binding protein